MSLSRIHTRVEKAVAGVALLSFMMPAAISPQAHADVRDVLNQSDFVEAKQLLNKKKWEEAAIVLRAVVKNDPGFVAGVMELARALTYLNRREEALDVISGAAGKQRGAHQEALVSSARVLSRLFLTQRTFQIYQDGLNLQQQGKYRPARERFEKALGGEPDNIEILTRIGQCLVFEGDFDSAAERLRLAKRLNPYEPEIRLWLGRALQERGEITEALGEFKFAQHELENSARAPIWYAEALVASGNRKAAAQVLEQDLKSQPFHLLTILALVRIRMQLFREGSDSLWNARKDLQLALSRLPQSGTDDATRFESDLGVELRQPVAELKAEITSLLSQLDARLQK